MLIEKINNNLKQEISGPLVLKPDIYTDQRGYFFETWNQRIFNEVFKLNIIFVQDVNKNMIMKFAHVLQTTQRHKA